MLMNVVKAYTIITQNDARWLPIDVSVESGLSLEQAREALKTLVKGGDATVDHDYYGAGYRVVRRPSEEA
jgi:hypothetical protein